MGSSSMSSEDWECVFEDDCQMVEIDNAFLMAFMEEGVEETEEERLGSVIRSLEAEIGADLEGGSGYATPQSGNYEDCKDCGIERIGSEDSYSCSRSPCHIDNPFDWIEMEMVNEVDNWYLDMCMDEVEIVDQFGGNVMNGDGMGDNLSFYYLDPYVEQAYSPLWQEDGRYVPSSPEKGVS